MGFVQFVLIVAAMQALGALGIDSMLPNLPAIGHALGVTQENRRQLIITCYMLGLGLSQVFYGSLGDRFGRRPILLGGILLYVVFSIIAALAPTFETLLAARVLQGIGAGATRVLPVAIVRDCYAGRAMARVMSLASMVFMGVPVLAPTLGQTVILFAPWPYIFGVLALFGGCVFLWVLVKLPETLNPQDRLPMSVDRIAGAFSVAASNRVAVGYTLAQTLLFGGLLGFINSSQQVFADSFHAAALFPLAFGLAAGSIAISALLNAQFVVRLGMRGLAHGGLLAYIAVSATHLVVAVSGHETLVVFTVFQMLSMFAYGLTTGNFGAMAMEPMGHIAGVASSLQGLVSTVGAALIGYVVGQSFDGSTVPVVTGFLLCGLGSLVMAMFAEKGRLFRAHHGTAAV